MQFAQPFQMIFRSTDPRVFNKLAIGTLYVLVSGILSIFLVGVLGFFIVAGYAMRVLKNVQTNQEHPLPEWDQWQTDLRNGFFLAVSLVVWLLPFLVVYLILGLNPVLQGTTEFSADSLPAMVAVGQSILVNIWWSLLPTVVGWVYGPAITIAFAQRMMLSDSFNFSRVLAWVGQNWAHCLLVSIVAIVMSIFIAIATTLIGALALGIGLIVMVPFGWFAASLYQNHLYGQLAQVRGLSVMFPDQVEPS